MFCKFIPHLSTFALVHGLSISDEPKTDAAEILSEIALPDNEQPLELTQQSDSPICHSWISFQDWTLFGICDDDAPGGR